jgi:hypothetical protein
MRIFTKHGVGAAWNSAMPAMLCVVLGAMAVPLQAQDMPLRTPDAETVSTGVLRAQTGFDFLQDQTFPLSGLSGDLTSVGDIDLRLGVGQIAEVELQGAIQQYLSIQSQTTSSVTLSLPNPNSTNDTGDYSLWTKIHIVDEQGRRPAIAFRFGYEMPNTNQARGIGTNTTNVYAEAILEKHFWQLDAFGNLGIGILQSPLSLFSQNDELLYGLAFRYPLPRRMTLLGEVNGRYSTRSITPGLIGTESESQARLGMQIRALGFRWDLGGIAGLTKYDPSSGFTLGVSRDVRVFHLPPVYQQ